MFSQIRCIYERPTLHPYCPLTVRCRVRRSSCCHYWRCCTKAVRVVRCGLVVGGVIDRQTCTAVAHCCQVLLQNIARVNFPQLVCLQPILSTTMSTRYHRRSVINKTLVSDPTLWPLVFDLPRSCGQCQTDSTQDKVSVLLICRNGERHRRTCCRCDTDDKAQCGVNAH